MTIAEALNSQGAGIEAPLKAGVETISREQTITFTLYKRLVLPFDGFIFWIKADTLSPSALANVSPLNLPTPNQPTTETAPANTLIAKGSLHYSTETNQDESASYGINKVIFTSEQEVQDLNAIGDDFIWLARHEEIRFAFSRRGSFYKQADLYHYTGDAVYPIMESQIIDDPATLDTRSIVISNSLPVWLQLNRLFPVYPSFAVPDNARPPFAAVHITPENTTSIQPVPHISRRGSHFQLAKDLVKITVYGVRNEEALAFQDYVNEYSLYTGVIGIMNMPIFRDEKRIQQELSMLAMKKSIEIEVSYYQESIRNISRQYIKSCIPTFYFPEAA